MFFLTMCRDPRGIIPLGGVHKGQRPLKPYVQEKQERPVKIRGACLKKQYVSFIRTIPSVRESHPFLPKMRHQPHLLGSQTFTADRESHPTPKRSKFSCNG